MFRSRQSFLHWISPHLLAVANIPILREPEEAWVEDCWRVTLFDESGSTANGFWTRVVQIDRYRSDGDSFAVEKECDDLLRRIGFKDNQETQVTIPRYDFSGANPRQTGSMTLSLLLGRSWRRNPDVGLQNDGLRHYVLSLQLDYQRD